MALVVFLRGVNIGGHRVFRPSALPARPTMRRHVIRGTVPIGLLAAALAACSIPHDMAGIAGVYVMSQKRASDTLRLTADGRYTRTYRVDDEPAVVDSGRWFLSRDARLVGLRDYPRRWAFVHDLMSDTTRGRLLTRPSSLALTVERSRLGALRLGWHSDWGWWYLRVGPSH